ncbi:MAG TPA: glycosyltransferase [Caulobacteraceae bacterium]
MIVAEIIGLAACCAWAYLLLGRGFFWLARERDAGANVVQSPTRWPSVVAIVPARNEADVVVRALSSLLAQDYAGRFRVILVDDASTDGTAALARALPTHASAALEILTGAPLPHGWTGKLWALAQGIERAHEGGQPPEYLWLTDADIAHAPDTLAALVQRASAGRLTLVSRMAKLSVQTWPERLLIPAFVFFFAMLYPFAWVNKASSRTAGAAGGCMLVHRDTLRAAGGLQAIAADIIDDCALAARMKRQGPIWLGLTTSSVSLRPYGSFGDIARMVTRSAYAQLRFSPLLLAGAVAGMALVYLSPALLTVFARGPARLAGGAAWLAMALAFQPMLRFYRRSPLWGAALPLIGGLYGLMTLSSAVEVWRGRGGMWKGRAQAAVRP